jgi:hypothetical protein
MLVCMCNSSTLETEAWRFWVRLGASLDVTQQDPVSKEQTWWRAMTSMLLLGRGVTYDKLIGISKYISLACKRDLKLCISKRTEWMLIIQSSCYINLFFFFPCGGTGVWTQGFVLAEQAFYRLSHISSPFCSSYCGDGVSRTICSGWPWNEILPIPHSHNCKCEPPVSSQFLTQRGKK